MRKYLSIPAILILWVVVHLDWHLARSHHHRLSMEWHEHWIVGLLAMFMLVLFCAWKWPERFVSAALLNATIGLFVGHIGEAWFEALRSHHPLNSELTPERWHAFFQFSLAGLAGLLLGTVLAFGWRRWRGKNEGIAQQ
jgi:hypothetical protein